MAQDPKQDAKLEQAPEKKSRKKLVLILAALLILGSSGGAAAWYFTKPKPHAPAEVKEEPAKTPVFVTLETFTINLVPEGEQQYLQVDITLQVPDEKGGELVKQHMPEVRNRLLLLLTSKKAAEISSIEGKKALSDQIVAQLQLPFAGSKTTQAISSVFFTSFVIQ